MGRPHDKVARANGGAGIIGVETAPALTVRGEAVAASGRAPRCRGFGRGLAALAALAILTAWPLRAHAEGDVERFIGLIDEMTAIAERNPICASMEKLLDGFVKDGGLSAKADV